LRLCFSWLPHFGLRIERLPGEPINLYRTILRLNAISKRVRGMGVT
jgi:hypothetical protein